MQLINFLAVIYYLLPWVLSMGLGLSNAGRDRAQPPTGGTQGLGLAMGWETVPEHP